MRRVSQTGSILTMVMVVALIAGISLYALLAIALADIQRANAFADHITARHLAEAANIAARERLWPENDPGYCPSSRLFGVDIDADGTGDENVEVTVTNCGANLPHAVITKATR